MPTDGRRVFDTFPGDIFVNSYNQKILKPLAGLSQWEKDFKNFFLIYSPQKWNDVGKGYILAA